MFAYEPTEDVQVVAALREDDRGSFLGISPVSSYIRMCHVTALDRLHVLDTDEFADHSGMDGLIHRPEIWAIAEHMADCYDVSVFVSLLGDICTLFFTLGHRFLKKDIISPLKSLHTWSIVGIIRCRDDYCVSEFRNGKDFTPVTETMLLRHIELVSCSILSRFADIGHADNLHALRIFLRVIGISTSPVAGSDDDNLYRTILDICFQSLDREIHFHICSR